MQAGHRDGDGQLSERLLYRDDEPSLELVELGRPWSFDGDGDLLRHVSERYDLGRLIGGHCRNLLSMRGCPVRC